MWNDGDWCTDQTMWPQLLHSLPHAERGWCSRKLRNADVESSVLCMFAHVTVICHLLQSVFNWTILTKVTVFDIAVDTHKA